MAISELNAGQGKVEIVVEVVSVSEPRTFEKFGKQGRVATAKAKDETGEINLSLWNDDIDKVSPGDKIKISNGYVSEFRGEKQLTTGRFGSMEVLEKGKPQDKPEVSEENIE
ncbi:SOSS complex subunit B family protein [Nanoarchaeota archaeon]